MSMQGPNGLLVVPPTAVRVDVDLRLGSARRARHLMGSLAPSTPVALWCSGPAAQRRSRRAARRGRILVEHEYVVLPSVESPTFLIEDRPDPVRWFTGRILTAPPSPSMSALAAALAVKVLRRPVASRFFGAVAPAHLVVGLRA